MTKDKIYKIFSHIPTIKTDRLILRALKTSDTDDMFEYSSDPEVPKYLLWKPHPDIKYTKEQLNRIKIQYRIGKFYDWAIEVAEGEFKGKMIGTCGFTSFDFLNNSAEVGYVLNRRFWGKGIVPEALDAVIAFGFDQLIVHRIEAKFIVGNDKSRHVMEKCGMTFEGVLRSSMIVKHEYTDIGICSILSDEYIKNKSYGVQEKKIFGEPI